MKTILWGGKATRPVHAVCMCWEGWVGGGTSGGSGNMSPGRHAWVGAQRRNGHSRAAWRRVGGSAAASVCVCVCGVCVGRVQWWGGKGGLPRKRVPGGVCRGQGGGVRKGGR